MKKLLFVFILVSCFLGFSCVSTDKSQETVSPTVTAVPKWVSDQGRRELFPDSEYISQLAYGDSAEDAKAKASSNISEYIKSSVKSSVTSNYFYNENESGFSENKQLSEDVEVATSNNLFKVEYTNPYYYIDLGKYVCVAFINKAQAFNYVKPKLENAKNEFPKSYANALEKEYLLEKIIGIRNAQEVLPSFYEVYDFARAINPAESKEYEVIDALANESFVNLKELTSSVLIKIEGVGDKEYLENSGVIAELSNQFETVGFVVGNSQKANCIALVEVKCLIKETSKTFETYPEISVKVLEQGKEQLSYTKKLTKVAGFDKETVIRRANLALVKEIQTSFSKEIL